MDGVVFKKREFRKIDVRNTNTKYSSSNKARTIEDEIASNSDSCSAASSDSAEKRSGSKRNSHSSIEGNGRNSNTSVELDSQNNEVEVV